MVDLKSACQKAGLMESEGSMQNLQGLLTIHILRRINSIARLMYISLI